ncbi:bifunctional alpha,alpha-trehalose-phosphate synthase (UDP-forming)/trehalose-phosphatase [Candidatus Bathyarchaeota archaeon]|nr:bifunctional alpha,alpha-trehalose-phosphate synthase (UDP-forming)/trehalose-phosphatase [Candidatus Bathyarchaeota archaeon]
MTRLLLVSNRLPINIVKRANQIHLQPSVGGVSKGLDSFRQSLNSVWIGWPGISTESIGEKKKYVEESLRSQDYYPVFISQSEIENYYHGFSNKTIWPLFHYFTQYTHYNDTYWDNYKRVNEYYCEAIIDILKKKDVIWIHDYQLMLLPKLIRDKQQDSKIGFFIHIPFPSFDVFRLLPWRKEILEGILGADLIGFHIHDYVRNFSDSVHRLFGYESVLGQMTIENRFVKTDVFPMGIDFQYFSTSVQNSNVQRESDKVNRRVRGRKVILSIDRLDYTKGIPQRLEAYDLFLERNPNYHEKVTFILVAVPSRTRVREYVNLKRQVDELVGRINGKYGTFGWTPIWYLHRFLPFNSLIALYNVADIALITPIRDGMNLIAKEFVATKNEGKAVLILSEMAGASKDLGEAIIVNPNNKLEVAEALEKAFLMSKEEQMEKIMMMRERLQRYDVSRWANDFLDNLTNIKKIQNKFCIRGLREIRTDIIKDYRSSRKRLFLLDYDGTLIPFADTPEKAKPDKEILRIIRNLAKDKNNEVVIISGRDRSFIEHWFGDENIGLVAEHGVWMKDKMGKWETMEPLSAEWKKEIRPILESYSDRTPGSFVEEKDFTLVWHYRKADPQLAVVRSRELKDHLLNFTASDPHRIGVLEGNKIIEVKNVDINKGRAALRWISKYKWDFILAIGDDVTDEDIFSTLPEDGYSIKIGYGASRAKYCLDSPMAARSLLKQISKIGMS